MALSPYWLTFFGCGFYFDFGFGLLPYFLTWSSVFGSRFGLGFRLQLQLRLQLSASVLILGLVNSYTAFPFNNPNHLTILTPARKRVHGFIVTVLETRRGGPGDWENYMVVSAMDEWTQEGEEDIWEAEAICVDYKVLMIMQWRRGYHDFCYEIHHLVTQER